MTDNDEFLHENSFAAAMNQSYIYLVDLQLDCWIKFDVNFTFKRRNKKELVTFFLCKMLKIFNSRQNAWVWNMTSKKCISCQLLRLKINFQSISSCDTAQCHQATMYMQGTQSYLCRMVKQTVSPLHCPVHAAAFPTPEASTPWPLRVLHDAGLTVPQPTKKRLMLI